MALRRAVLYWASAATSMAVLSPHQPKFVRRLVEFSHFDAAVNSTWQFGVGPHEIVANGMVESGEFKVTRLHDAGWEGTYVTIEFDVTFETIESIQRGTAGGEDLQEGQLDTLLRCTFNNEHVTLTPVRTNSDGRHVFRAEVDVSPPRDNDPYPASYAVLKLSRDRRPFELRELVEEILHQRVVKEGVSWRDGAVPDQLAHALNLHVDELAASQAKPDYHPNSNGVVRDLVHPALYPYIHGTSRFVPSEQMPKPPRSRTDIRPDTRDRWGRRYSRSAYQWLPTPFAIDEAGKCTVKGDINNLDRASNEPLYACLASLFEVMLPHFEATVGYGRDFSARVSERTSPVREVSTPAALHNRELQVITKIVDYELKEGQRHEGVWHVEGMSHEHIVATGVYIAGRTPTVHGGSLMFQRGFTVSEAEAVNDSLQRNRFWLREVRDLLSSNLLPLGHLGTPAGRFVVFPNSHVHKVSTMMAKGGAGKRRIVVFWLVDPEVHIVSTREVPPQQGVMSLESALEHRLQLMKPRRALKQERNVEVVHLCEH